jgi:hypothetical protein
MVNTDRVNYVSRLRVVVAYYCHPSHTSICVYINVCNHWQ